MAGFADKYRGWEHTVFKAQFRSLSRVLENFSRT